MRNSTEIVTFFTTLFLLKDIGIVIYVSGHPRTLSPPPDVGRPVRVWVHMGDSQHDLLHDLPSSPNKNGWRPWPTSAVNIERVDNNVDTDISCLEERIINQTSWIHKYQTDHEISGSYPGDSTDETSTGRRKDSINSSTAINRRSGGVLGTWGCSFLWHQLFAAVLTAKATLVTYLMTLVDREWALLVDVPTVTDEFWSSLTFSIALFRTFASTFGLGTFLSILESRFCFDSAYP